MFEKLVNSNLFTKCANQFKFTNFSNIFLELFNWKLRNYVEKINRNQMQSFQFSYVFEHFQMKRFFEKFKEKLLSWQGRIEWKRLWSFRINNRKYNKNYIFFFISGFNALESFFSDLEILKLWFNNFRRCSTKIKGWK